MPSGLKKVLFILFLISGFCSLLYEVVWLRLAFASFGIITPVMSLVLSVFMLGLAVGCWLAGIVADSLSVRTRLSAIVYYALAELCIGVGAFTVPQLFSLGERWLLSAGEMDSASYLMLSAVIVVMSILPFSACMGATFPLMMAFVRERDRTESRSFSFLYLANVIGAMCGTLITALVLVELFGFHRTLLIGAVGNFFVAITSIYAGLRCGGLRRAEPASADFVPAVESADFRPVASGTSRGLVWLILFTTGLASMALEVVWTRAFTPVLKTQVYSFASLLFTYLLATWVGSYVYRRHLAHGRVLTTGRLLNLLALAAFLQIIIDDPRLHSSVFVVLASIFPFCGLLGYLTPKLIDDNSAGHPRQAGYAYALNVLGCIVGPLAAAYLLLPAVGVKWSSVILASPVLLLALAVWRQSGVERKPASLSLVPTLACLAIACGFSTSYEELYAAGGAVVRRDHTATVISYGKGMQKGLLINGKETTAITTTTKIMAHMPLAFCPEKPESALVICFGMGATFRSVLSWDIRATVVELVPSVRDAFGYYHADAEEVMRNPLGRVIIDDGRRFLKRTQEQFDVITLDPPPPPEAAGSSLLYSEEFYDLVKQRLKPHGILQQWFPGGDLLIFRAVVRSLTNSFPHVKIYRAYDGWGLHLLASLDPIVEPSIDTMIERMPERARRDLMEWSPREDLRGLVARILAEDRRVPTSSVVAEDRGSVITDDRPFNEYFALRRLWQHYWLDSYPIVL